MSARTSQPAVNYESDDEAPKSTKVVKLTDTMEFSDWDIVYTSYIIVLPGLIPMSRCAFSADL